MGVALTSARTVRPSGTESITSSARIVSPLWISRSMGELAEVHFAAVGAAEGHHLQKLLVGMARGAQGLADARRLAVACDG